MSQALAVLGGPPTSERAWPVWPIADPGLRENLDEVLASGRWTISNLYRGAPSFEQRFAEAWAASVGVAHCTPTASGTTALTVALEACGVGAGDEVIVPGLSWVASASAVLGINAVPILVDVDPDTFCLDPAAVERALSDRTAAITAVHLYSAVADLDALGMISERHAIPLIEDCAQAHGARHRGRSVGSIGSAGCFSMQGSKLMTSGEGGAVTTNDRRISELAEHLRADGRSRSSVPPAAGSMELLETAVIMGSNACMSEFHAAVLLAQLPHLEQRSAARAATAARLDQLLSALGCTPQTSSEGTTRRAYYRYAFKVPDDVVSSSSADSIARALSAELGFPLAATHRVLNDNPLIRPATRKRFALGPDHQVAIDPARFDLPVATEVYRSTITFGHEILLAPLEAMDDIAAAVDKVLVRVDELT